MRNDGISTKISNFLKDAKNPLIVVLGPTASGKTALSLGLAKDFDCEIISTDSRQIYTDMPISTATIPQEDRQGIPHHMLGIVTPDRTMTLTEFTDLAIQKIGEIKSRGKIPMLVGGTGLYISAIIESYQPPRVAPDPALRRKLEKEAEIHGNDYLYKKLRKLDPDAAKTIHPNNLRYVIRALEINAAKGRKKPSEKLRDTPQYDIFMIGIEYPRGKLYERINRRVDEQIRSGLTDEVRSLLELGYSETLPSMSSLGIKEIVPYVRGKLPLEECLEILKRNTRRYAKRQMTWFRRYDNVHWLQHEE